MSDKKWSFARQQKYDFCRRAFYFHYIHNADFTRQDNHSDSPLNLFKLKSFAFNTLFYDRSLTLSSFFSILFKEGCKLDISPEKVEEISFAATDFTKSEFYLKTSPALVFHNQPEQYASTTIEDIDILGSIDFVWTEKNSQLNLVCLSRKSLPFAALYAMRKLHAVPGKLNIGVMENHFGVKWHEIDWPAVQEIQDMALSFNYSQDLADFPLTESTDKCQYCSFNQTCSEITSQDESLSETT